MNQEQEQPRVAEDAPANAATRVEAAADRGGTKVPTRVLAVDDHPDVLFVLERLLRRRGYEVRTANGGAEALAAVAEEPPDVVLLDVMMPGIHGLEVLRRLREEPRRRRLPVILVTARGQDVDILDGYRRGADYYLPKPFTGEQVDFAIRLVLGRGAGA